MASASHDDPLIRQLLDRRASLEAELAGVDNAIEALTGAPHTNGRARGKLSVGDDKLDAVRQYILEHGSVRQAEIAQELKLNSGTVSTATHALMVAGEIARGPKLDRSVTWRAVQQ